MMASPVSSGPGGCGTICLNAETNRPCKAVLLVEYQDGENPFHANYAVEKYRTYAMALRREVTNVLPEVEVQLNCGPPAGFSADRTLAGGNWYTSRATGERLRYPRLGSFEVTLRVYEQDTTRTELAPTLLQDDRVDAIADLPTGKPDHGASNSTVAGTGGGPRPENVPFLDLQRNKKRGSPYTELLVFSKLKTRRWPWQNVGSFVVVLQKVLENWSEYRLRGELERAPPASTQSARTAGVATVPDQCGADYRPPMVFGSSARGPGPGSAGPAPRGPQLLQSGTTPRGPPASARADMFSEKASLGAPGTHSQQNPATTSRPPPPPSASTQGRGPPRASPSKERTGVGARPRTATPATRSGAAAAPVTSRSPTTGYSSATGAGGSARITSRVQAMDFLATAISLRRYLPPPPHSIDMETFRRALNCCFYALDEAERRTIWATIANGRNVVLLSDFPTLHTNIGSTTLAAARTGRDGSSANGDAEVPTPTNKPPTSSSTAVTRSLTPRGAAAAKIKPTPPPRPENGATRETPKHRRPDSAKHRAAGHEKEKVAVLVKPRSADSKPTSPTAATATASTLQAGQTAQEEPAGAITATTAPIRSGVPSEGAPEVAAPAAIPKATPRTPPASAKTRSKAANSTTTGASASPAASTTKPRGKAQEHALADLCRGLLELSTDRRSDYYLWTPRAFLSCAAFKEPLNFALLQEKVGFAVRKFNPVLLQFNSLEQICERLEKLWPARDETAAAGAPVDEDDVDDQEDGPRIPGSATGARAASGGAEAGRRIIQNGGDHALFPAGVTPGKEQSRPSSRPGSGSAASGSNNSRPASRAGGPPGRPGSAAAAQRGGGSAAGAGNGKFDVRHDDPATLFPPVETSDARKLYAELHSSYDEDDFEDDDEDESGAQSEPGVGVGSGGGKTEVGATTNNNELDALQQPPQAASGGAGGRAKVPSKNKSPAGKTKAAAVESQQFVQAKVQPQDEVRVSTEPWGDDGGTFASIWNTSTGAPSGFPPASPPQIKDSGHVFDHEEQLPLRPDSAAGGTQHISGTNVIPARPDSAAGSSSHRGMGSSRGFGSGGAGVDGYSASASKNSVHTGSANGGRGVGVTSSSRPGSAPGVPRPGSAGGRPGSAGGWSAGGWSSSRPDSAGGGLFNRTLDSINSAGAGSAGAGTTLPSVVWSCGKGAASGGVGAGAGAGADRDRDRPPSASVLVEAPVPVPVAQPLYANLERAQNLVDNYELPFDDGEHVVKGTAVALAVVENNKDDGRRVDAADAATTTRNTKGDEKENSGNMKNEEKAIESQSSEYEDDFEDQILPDEEVENMTQAVISDGLGIAAALLGEDCVDEDIAAAVVEGSAGTADYQSKRPQQRQTISRSASGSQTASNVPTEVETREPTSPVSEEVGASKQLPARPAVPGTAIPASSTTTYENVE